MRPPTAVARCLLLWAATAVSLQGSGIAALPGADKSGAAAPLGLKLQDFERQDLTGHHVSLRALRGHVVLLNFWATWCAPCLTEIPVFSQWQRTYGHRGLQVIGVAMDDDPQLVTPVLRKLHPSYPVLMGDAPLARSFGGVLGLPVSVLIGRDGIVRRRYDGAPDLHGMERDIAAALR